MKVKELIELLKNEDSNSVICLRNRFDYQEANSLKKRKVKEVVINDHLTGMTKDGITAIPFSYNVFQEVDEKSKGNIIVVLEINKH